MKDANDFAKAATQMAQLATEMKPSGSDEYREMRSLIEYHLLAAASRARIIAEAIGEKARAAGQ